MDIDPNVDLTTEEARERAGHAIENNEVALFVKGTRAKPECGYSEKALALVSRHRDEFEVVNVLHGVEAYREVLEPHSGRETIPQTFVDGEFVGGSDILEQLEERGELADRLEA